MFKKILCLIALTLVVGVFDSIAMDAPIESNKSSNDSNNEELNSKESQLKNKQLELIIKSKKFYESKDSETLIDSQTV